MRGFTSSRFARLRGAEASDAALMTVGNVMRSHDLPVVAPDCSATGRVIHAISKGDWDLSSICGGDRIEGVVTDGDVRRAAWNAAAEFFNIRAADHRAEPEDDLCRQRS